MNLLRKAIDWNRKWSQWFDRQLLPKEFIIDGNQDYMENLVRAYVVRGQKIYDVGGGKRPFFSSEEKKNYALQVTGIDISTHELSRAPDGAYDHTIACDISRVIGNGDGDVVICQAVLEHVKDTENAMRGIASLLKKGGRALIFVPCRNALFARLNLLLPQKIKEWVLFAIYPIKRQSQGFPSFYHRCTPNDFFTMSRENGMVVELTQYYYKSSYFEFLFPVYVLWRLYQRLAVMLIHQQAVETFAMVVIKPAEHSQM